jgi:hypothetical protein
MGSWNDAGMGDLGNECGWVFARAISHAEVELALL